eukprot:g13989.t1
MLQSSPGPASKRARVEKQEPPAPAKPSVASPAKTGRNVFNQETEIDALFAQHAEPKGAHQADAVPMPAAAQVALLEDEAGEIEAEEADEEVHSELEDFDEQGNETEGDEAEADEADSSEAEHGDKNTVQDYLIDLPFASQTTVPATGRPDGLRQGDRGFTEAFQKFLREQRNLPRYDHNSGGAGSSTSGLLPHQEVALAGLASGHTPRILIDHRTGSGKTRTMIEALDLFFMSENPKVVIVPTENLKRNFLLELVRWPSKWRVYWSVQHGQFAATAAGTRNWVSRMNDEWAPNKNMIASMEDIIGLKGKIWRQKISEKAASDFVKDYPQVAFPKAPVRIISYARAGGSAMKPSAPDLILRFGKKVLGKKADGSRESWQGVNMWSGAVVLLDEAHNCVKSQSAYARQLEKLTNALKATDQESTRLILLTATPAGGSKTASSPNALLNIVKGSGNMNRGHEGYVSHYDGQAGFPTVLVTKKPYYVFQGELQQVGASYRKANVVRVEMGGGVYGRYLRVYSALPNLHDRTAAHYRKLASRCVTWMPPQFSARAEQREKLLLHEKNMKAFATKAYKAGLRIRTMQMKSLVLVSKQNGLKAVAAVLEEMLGEDRVLSLTDRSQVADAMEKFNAPSNANGEQYTCLVADTDTCGEGVSFMSKKGGKRFVVEGPIVAEAFYGGASVVLRTTSGGKGGEAQLLEGKVVKVSRGESAAEVEIRPASAVTQRLGVVSFESLPDAKEIRRKEKGRQARRKRGAFLFL